MKKSGITLIETLLAGTMTILIIVIASHSNGIFMKVGMEGVSVFTAQMQSRSNLTTVTKKIKNSGSIYFLPGSYFETHPEVKENMPLKFGFITVEPFEDFSQLINYVPNETDDDHDRVIISSSLPDYEYKLVLDKDIITGDVTGFSFVTQTPSGKDQKVSTSINSLNAGVVEDFSEGEEQVIVAYSPETLPPSAELTPFAIYAAIDNSHKMLKKIDGSDSVTPNDTRAYLARAGFSHLFTMLSAHENVYFGAQGFFTFASANQRQPLVQLSDPANFAALTTLFSPSEFVNNYASLVGIDPDPVGLLRPALGANIGDGIRMAYHRLLLETASLGLTNPKNYIILITAGIPDTATYNVSLMGGPAAARVYFETNSSVGSLQSYFYTGDAQLVAGDDFSFSSVTSTVTAGVGVYGVAGDLDYLRAIAYIEEIAALLAARSDVDGFYELGLGPPTMDVSNAIVAGFTRYSVRLTYCETYSAPTEGTVISGFDAIGSSIINSINAAAAPPI